MQLGVHSVGRQHGAPLSPLLSNILLDELDKELESRGHRFVQYADDCSIYVGSRLRYCIWSQWKRVLTRYKALRKLEASHRNAYYGPTPGKVDGTPLTATC